MENNIKTPAMQSDKVEKFVANVGISLYIIIGATIGWGCSKPEDAVNNFPATCVGPKESETQACAHLSLNGDPKVIDAEAVFKGKKQIGDEIIAANVGKRYRIETWENMGFKVRRSKEAVVREKE